MAPSPPKSFPLWLGTVLVALGAIFQLSGDQSQANAKPKPGDGVNWTAPLIYQGGGDIPMPIDTPAAHASSLVAMSASNSRAIAVAWFAGERESAPDVRIAFSQFDRKHQQWQPASFILSRKDLGEQLGYGVRRLGNPVLWRDDQDRLHLFVVATGLGGWAASRIVHLTQINDLQSSDAPRFRAKQTLPLSWFWNTSHLVRNSPLSLADGSIALPIYFELGSKYPLIAWISKSGEFNGITRISSRTNLLQPAIVPIDRSRWLAYMRMSGGAQRIAVAESNDSGRHWRDLPDLGLPNPNSATAAIGVGNATVLAFNPEMNSRSVLSLALSNNGLNWAKEIDLERGNPGDEFSYPSLAWADDSLWVSYTNRRQKISWQRFVMVKN